jgi:hypothetical protein
MKQGMLVGVVWSVEAAEKTTEQLEGLDISCEKDLNKTQGTVEFFMIHQPLVMLWKA